VAPDRGEAVGKVMVPGWVVVSVEGECVRTKKELVEALQKFDVAAALTFVFRELREEASMLSAVVATKQATRTHVSSGTEVFAGRGSVVSVALERHPKHGYGLDLSDDLVVNSVRSPAQVCTVSFRLFVAFASPPHPLYVIFMSA
jgi:hypothetical protein